MNDRFVFSEPGDFGANDCVIRAFMQATGMSFTKLCKDFGLKSKSGRLLDPDDFTGLSWMDVPRKYLCRSVELYKWSEWGLKKLTVNDFCDITAELYPGISFVLGCEGRLRGKMVDHATFVKDGKFYDLYEKVGKWTCSSFFAFKNGRSIHLKEDPDPYYDESFIRRVAGEVNESTKVTLTLGQLKRLISDK